MYGRILAQSTMYVIFTNPFYYGWFEYPRGSGNWYKGAHEPMITPEEYDKVQLLLGRKGRPRPKKHNFAFTGLIRCGECGGTVTAEEKNQLICSNCKYKFSYSHRSECPKCGILIEKMQAPTILKYVYYHCTKRINPGCSQGSVEVKELEKQIKEYLSGINISEGFKDWAIKYLKKENEKEFASREAIVNSQRKAHDNCVKKLGNLFQLKISPLNAGGSLLSDEEYARQKSGLMQEKIRLEEIITDTNGRVEKWLDIAEKTFGFACYAGYWFAKATPEEKSATLQALGSNLTLTGKKLSIHRKKLFVPIENIAKGVPELKPAFEPEINGLNKRGFEAFCAHSPRLLRELDEVRTCCIEMAARNEDYSWIPDFRKRLHEAA